MNVGTSLRNFNLRQQESQRQEEVCHVMHWAFTWDLIWTSSLPIVSVATLNNHEHGKWRKWLILLWALDIPNWISETGWRRGWIRWKGSCLSFQPEDRHKQCPFGAAASKRVHCGLQGCTSTGTDPESWLWDLMGVAAGKLPNFFKSRFAHP